MPAAPNGDMTNASVALWHLRRATEDTVIPYKRDDPELTSELKTDVSVQAIKALNMPDVVKVWYQPWLTASRILQYTDYNVTEGITSTREANIPKLRRIQRTYDLQNGIPLPVSLQRQHSVGTFTGKFVVSTK